MTKDEATQSIQEVTTCLVMVLNLTLVVCFAIAAYRGDWWVCAVIAYIEVVQINGKVKR